ncbi:hypothetical protein [Microbacterium sp. 77mftsu3.1]|uniref:hypothetical protein n=1 Tax=Microbacterium sp. 77mftsu3.1 TaxID=1761802 RepID=UPI00036B5309|nr:hypothetical protein [Microbacterium sp. 77mftsu3.1]SDG22729.1 hypothetical protein SAMN04488590_0247 [Microbacterium sp. 77mftsu3.1]
MSVGLSPAEQQEVTRFGIHDEEAFREISEHADAEVTCQGCEQPAVAIATTRCCKTSRPICQHHIEVSQRFLARHALVVCGFCKADISGWSFDEAVELRPL